MGEFRLLLSDFPGKVFIFNNLRGIGNICLSWVEVGTFCLSATRDDWPVWHLPYCAHTGPEIAGIFV